METTGTTRAMADAAGILRRWFEEVWNQGRMETIDELFPVDAVLWGTGRPDAASTGPTEFKEFYKALRGACPDIRITVEDVVQEGDMAFARWTARMTHTGEGLGMPATNRAMTLAGMSACRAKDGKLVEGWNVWDQLGMIRELGLLSGPGAEMFR
ncbi:MAG TPA: ester cyclase [Candidatus Dormibacteraeota bacterium]|nr:ester cyclase [Candidatus Dormibacteraeota bacterium]